MVGSSSGSAKHRGVSLPRIQTSFCNNSQQHLQRPRPAENITLKRATERGHSTDSSSPPIGRQSRGGIFGIFGRGRTAAAQKASQTREVGGKGKEFIVRHETVNPSKPSQEIQGDHLPNEVHARRPGKNYPATSLQHRGSKGKSKSQLGTQEPVAKNLGPWDPPELFKAYPQAIRHVRLRAPLLSAETILHSYEATKDIATKEDVTKAYPDQNVDISKGPTSRTKHDEEKKTERSTQSIWSNISWTEKIYVLTTSGHLLRYTGSGSYDRVPEKIMSLGKHSAFVSDAMPGQHYVLQISRVTKDGSINTDMSRSIFKRLGFRSNSKRVASNLLLVFDSPEEMNEWLVLLRKEIESLGGRKYLPDVPRETTENSVKQLMERSSRRYLIQKDSDRFTDSALDPDARVGGEGSSLFRSGLVNGHASIRKSLASCQQKSIDSPSLSYITTSTDQIYLEQLRGTPRLSYASAGGKTLSTSWGSSPGPSPARAAFFPEDSMTKLDGPEIPVRESSQLGPFLTAKYPLIPASCSSALAPDASEQRTRRRTSTYSTSSEQTASWPPPNFSVPSFSKRYSYSALIPDSQKKAMSLSHIQQEKCVDQSKFAQEERRLSEGLNTTKPSVNADHSILPSLSSPCVDPIAFDSNVEGDLPHNFSSPASCRGNSPCRPAVTPAESPHPPPTTALPALPEQHHDRKSSGNFVDNFKQERPISLQCHNNPIPRLRCSLPQIGQQNPSEVDEYTLSSPSSKVQPSSSTSDLSRVPCVQSTLQQCKSMPQLSADSVKPSTTDLSLLPEAPLPSERVSRARENSAGPHRACGVPEPLFRPMEII